MLLVVACVSMSVLASGASGAGTLEVRAARLETLAPEPDALDRLAVVSFAVAPGRARRCALDPRRGAVRLHVRRSTTWLAGERWLAAPGRPPRPEPVDPVPRNRRAAAWVRLPLRWRGFDLGG